MNRYFSKNLPYNFSLEFQSSLLSNSTVQLEDWIVAEPTQTYFIAIPYLGSL